MKSVKTSLIVFGLYLILIPGVGMIFFPDSMSTLFDVSYGGQIWMVRMMGWLTLLIGVIEFFIGKYELAKLFMLTVVLRYMSAAFMTTLWGIGEADISILGFAAMDALGATWTFAAMKLS